MYKFENLLKHRDLFEEFIERISGDYSEDLELISEGYHFNQRTLEASGVPLKYTWEDIDRAMSGLGIKFPECVTPWDISYTVNHLYQKYYPLIPDLSGAVKFAEKYIKDPDWPEFDKPYRLYYDYYG